MFYGGGKREDGKDIYKKYRSLMKSLVLTPDNYAQIKAGFAGGFTHANVLYARETVKNVWSKDFTSSYPYVMLAEKFPMSEPRLVKIRDKEHFNSLLDNYCCIFDIELVNVRPRCFYENYISKSHCRELEGAEYNNGRVVRADHLKTTITELDYKIIERFYDWDYITIHKFNIMDKAYLPKSIILSILDFYEGKTKLKGVAGMEVEYLQSKERINSIFGMCVTDIVRDKLVYSPAEWTVEKPELAEAVNKNNNSLKRFLYYPWGVWVTAYARYNLFSAIYELENDYVYSDTDSVKYINPEKHTKYFENYNKLVIQKLNRAMNFHGIDPERTRPMNIKGEKKQIGIWDDEGMYTRFKTLGAKRYMTEKEGKISITVSGLNKGVAVPYLLEKYGEGIFEAFDDTLYIPAGKTGKMTHTYIDDEHCGIITDYLGSTQEYKELSAIHLSAADYSLSLDEFYLDYIMGIHDEDD